MFNFVPPNKQNITHFSLVDAALGNQDSKPVGMSIVDTLTFQYTSHN